LDIGFHVACKTYCWLLEPVIDDSNINNIQLDFDYWDTYSCEILSVYDGQNFGGNLLRTVYGDSSVQNVLVVSQTGYVFVSLATCCNSSFGNWSINYSSNEKSSDTVSGAIIGFWNYQRTISYVIISVVGFIIVAIVVSIIVWRIVVRKKSTDEEWVELGRSREDIKKNRAREEFMTESKKKLEECLSKSTTDPVNRVNSPVEDPQDSISKLQDLFKSNNSDHPETKVTPLDSEIIIVTPPDTPFASQSIELSGISSNYNEDIVPQTPIETPQETPISTPSSTLREREAVGYIDDVLQEFESDFK